MSDLDAGRLLALDRRELRALLGRLSESDRARVVQELGRVQEAVKQNPLLAYRPLPEQAAFHGLQGGGNVRLLLGGNRGGKTTGSVADDVIQCVDREVVPPHLQTFKFWEPPFFLRVITVDFKQSHEVVIDKFKEWTPPGQLRGGSWKKAYDTLARRLWFKNGSHVEFMSQEQDKTAFQGTARHRVHFDEEPKYDHGKKIWNECMARLMDFNGDTVISMTPLLGMSWVYDDLYVPGTTGRRDNVKVVTLRTHDNVHLSKAGIDAYFESMGTLSKDEYEARSEGAFRALSGSIYPEWDPEVHKVGVLQELPPVGPHRRQTVVCIDPGAANPRVCLLFADDAGRVTVFDEIAFPKGAPIRTVARAIKDRLEGWKIESPSWYVIDPSARNREQGTGRSVAQEYAAEGIPTRPGNNTRAVGIGRQKALLETPGYFRVTENCEHLLQEFPKYRWKEGQRSEDAVREQAVKRDDHSLDCVRYGILTLPDPQIVAGEESDETDEIAGRVARPKNPIVGDLDPGDGGPGIWI